MQVPGTEKTIERLAEWRELLRGEQEERANFLTTLIMNVKRNVKLHSFFTNMQVVCASRIVS